MSGTDYYVEKYVDELSTALTYIHSIDGFLIKLGTIVHELEDMCREDKDCNTVSIISEILKHPKLKRKLSRFSCYVGEIVETINTDPRHKILRKYVNVIKIILEEIECVERGKEITVYTPEALWVKESREREYIVEAKTKFPKRIGPVEVIYGILGLVAILFIVSIILLLS